MLQTERSIGPWVRQARLKKGLTQEMLAERVGCATATIRKIETGDRRPSFQMAERLAGVFEFATDERTAFLNALHAPAEPLPQTQARLSAHRAASRAKLPTYLTPFIGREQMLAELMRLLSTPQGRLLTLLGPGGIGKTRMAVELARQCSLFADGVVFVALGSTSEEQAVAPTIADALDVNFGGASDLTRQLLNYLQPKQLLLVLDNLEHLLHGAVLTNLISAILHTAPEVTILATSRERLRLSGEWVIEPGGLRVADDLAAPAGPPSEAMLLFAERARHLQSDFVLGAENRSAVVAISRLLDGNPLAIEMAATWVRTLSCAEIVDEIGRSLDFLSLADRDQPGHHQSMRAVFEHSWQLLTADEQRVLEQLSVFRGSFTREAAQQVAAASLVHLANFVTKSLLRPTKHRRYELHELLRQFTFEKLQAASQLGAHPDKTSYLVATLSRHLNYFLALAETAEPQLEGREQVAYLTQLEEEQDNLRAALIFALQIGPDENLLREAGARLTAALSPFWFIRGHQREGQNWVEQALTVTPADAPVQARLRTAAGFYAALRHNDPVARQHLEAAIQLSQREHNARNEARAWHYLGLVASSEGDNSADREAQQHCIRIAEALGDAHLRVLALVELGCCARNDHDYAQAEALFREGIEHFTALGDKNQLAAPVRRLGHIAFLRQDYAQASKHFQHSLALNTEVGDRRGVAACLLGMACVFVAKGRTNDAVRLLGAEEHLLTTVADALMHADRDDFEGYAAQIKAQLHDPVLAAAYAEGQQLSFEQAIALAGKA